MSRGAAEAGLERFLDRTVDAIRREFSVGRALDGTVFGPGGRVIDRLRANADALERRIVEPEVRTYRRRAVRQFEILIECIERDEPIENYRSELLRHDAYLETLRPDATDAQRDAVIEANVSRLERLASGIEPIVDRPEDEFWAAVRGAYDREEATALVEEAFPFTEPLRTYREAFAFEVDLDPNELLESPFLPNFPALTIDYTDEAVRAMTRGERQVVRELRREIDERFQSDGISGQGP